MAHCTNRLIHETSPYLLQHARNPVAWYPWGDAAFAEAGQRDMPVFLSIGYSTCHWCHVMERECFEDARVADYLNDHFVSIKVDREERPDIDHLYMRACTAMTGQGGWPLSCFLTPDKKPFFAGTYFPKDDRPGMRGFLSILMSIAGLWGNDRQRLLSASDDIFIHLSNPAESMAAAPDYDMGAVAFEQLCAAFDATYGGFGTEPKFPSAHNLLFLMRYGRATGYGRAADMVRTTIAAMRRGGIWDHIGGGFCRYATDRQWLVPHFEKMMYDNAMMAIACSEAGAAVDERFFSTARRIFEYAFADMADTDGGFFTARDADSEGEEGRYYVFTPREIKDALGPDDGRRFCRLFDITPQGNFEGKSIPNLLRSDPSDDDTAFADACFPVLLRYRSQRLPPLRDDKKLTSVNGLMLAALATAGRIVNDTALVGAAGKTGLFILENLFQGDRLHASLCRGKLRHQATSDDYAYVLWGLFELYQATLQPRWLARCMRLAHSMLDLFQEGRGGLYLTGRDVHDLPLRTKNTYDGALPSGNAVAAQQLLRLADVTRNDAYREAAMAIIDAVTAEVKAYPAGFTGLLCADLYARRGGQQAVVAQGAGLDELLRALRGFNPFLTVTVCGEAYPEMSGLAPHTKDCKPLGGRATAYICSPQGCLAPLTDPEQAAREAGLLG